MGKRTRKRIWSFLCAFLLILTGFETSGFTGIFAAASSRTIDVWDFGCVAEENTDLYSNNITKQTWDDCADVGTDGKFVAGTTTFGDLSITHNANDRLYSQSTKNYGTAAAIASTAYDDGYTASGMFYCNGVGSATTRYITIDNVKAGDTIVVYMGASNAATGNIHFVYLGENGTQENTDTFTNVGKKYEFVATYDGSYKIYTDSAKAIFNRVVRIPGVQVVGTVDLGDTGVSSYSVKLTNDTTGVSTELIMLDGNMFGVSLAAGYTYTATLSGATGYGFTSESKKITTSIDEVLSGKSGVVLTVEQKTTYTYSGHVTGFAESADLSKLSVILEADEDSLADDVTLNVAADGSFSAILEPDVTYTAVLYGVNDYEITEGLTINDNQNHTSDIVVAAKALYNVSGSFTGLSGASVSELKFVNVADSYEYTAEVTADGFTAKLRDGSYSVSTSVDGYRTTTHIVVNGADVKKDILFVSTAAADKLERVSDIYVGYEDKGALNYNTVNEAVAAAASMNPSSEAERITIHIAPGTYREQIIISTPYISLVNDTQEEVLLTWYYGIGYSYYSADSTGYYNAENAYDKYEKNTVSKWGCSVLLKSTATGFTADGITFEASFNRYITDEEIEDGVEVADTSLPARKYGTDVTSKAATERATAMAIESTNVEFTNCSFLGSQDTLYTGNSASSIYFKNCFITGNTDYIFGDGNCVFDGCELQWYGYSTGSVSGYVTAMKPTSSATAYGYLFRNCTITSNPDLTVTEGYLGRPWGSDAKVTFMNTKLTSASIKAAGWTEMSGNKAEKANFHEYNTTNADGTAVDVSGRVTGNMTADEAAAVNVKSYFGDWTPASYTEEAATVSFTTNPYVVDNGDINAPYPGHTLTVGYSLGEVNDKADASVIRWYVVEDDGTETLVKSSTASADKTYQITSDAAGKHIKVVVVPQTISGTTGSEQSYKVEAFVREGYEDPSTGNTDITLGEGVNIFLAGDSTVKDYSASGMYMSGKAQAEGSWGEFLQSYFNSSTVTVQNYANGGRSSRNFINEGSLDAIAQNIKAGDYLFIQFGHNDCANGSGYLEDRYVPLGEPDENGIYPTTAGEKTATPSSLQSKYGDTFYSYDCGGTYKWYLQQYIDVAKNAGAIPVLVTPVSRTYFSSDGTIYAHHDSTDTTTNTQVTTDNAYVTAVKQLAEEQDVMLIDAFELTKTMYETAYANDTSAANAASPLVAEVMATGEKTHSNKLGGFLTAGLIAEAILDSNINISSEVIVPEKVGGTNPDGQQVFTVNGKSELSAYTKDSDGNFTVAADYWTTYGQNILDTIAKKKDAAASGKSSTVWVIGDSTVSSFNDAYYYPRYGYGTQLANYFDSTITVQNLALSGRSSKSYVNDPEYQTLMSGMTSGDYLIIGFGHNDEKAEAERYTNPNGDYTTEGSFANSLYENYIKPAQEAGVTVILATPIVRRTSDGVWTNSSLHITSDSGEYAGGDYSQAVRDLGTALNIPVVDMTTLTKNLYDSLGASETLYLHAWTSSNSSSVDNTHTNIWGGAYNAYLMTQEIKKLNVSGLAEHVLDAEAPTKDTLVKNPDYVEVDYTPATGISELWKQIGIWSGTVFGNVGGAAKINTDNFTLVETEDGGMHIAVANNAGKIASTADGIAMYYYKVPSSSTFTLTATMTINSFASNDQVSFGLMARDEIYVDEYHSETIGDYVAAGPLKLTKSGSQWNCFARKSGVLTQGGTLSKDVVAGDVVDLKIESNSDGYACTYGTESAITGGFDFKLTTIDSDYVYVGMFVSRNADVTFSNVKLVVDGKEVVAGSGDTTTPSTGNDDTTTPSTGNGDTTTPSTGSSDTTTPSAGSDKTYSAVAAENLAAAEVSSDAVAKDAAGNVADIKNAKVTAKDDYVSAQKAEIDSILTNNGINPGENKLYYNVSLTGADGSALTLEGGSVKLTFAYPAGINADNYDFNVYHIKTDGTVEQLSVTKADNGIVVETTSFSPFVISYTLKAADTASGSGENSSDSVNTGDSANPAPYVIMLGAAMLLVLGTSKKKIKNN